MPAIDLSVVTPAHNEEGNVAALVGEIERTFAHAGILFELIIVDDGSTDATRARALDAASGRDWVRVIAMSNTPPGRGCGQSAAFAAGFAVARGRLIATMDADLQNDPADLPAMLDLLERSGADVVQGDRSRSRRDNWMRRRTSAVGRVFRRLILGDRVRDTGCSLRVMKREVARALPLNLRGMHRFIPVTARDLGYRVVEMPVVHRQRSAGETKYGKAGILKRAIPGLVDCFAVRYMRSRRTPVEAVELAAAEARP
ncbi:MAG: glycosyltransferase [Phycisphaeraceae bacterium]|nr:glycosyltransferase [Phycisphaeraceae bacterium]MCW5763473.1 glycosyltransferase [Phycisphaeraceae bacterium]